METKKLTIRLPLDEIGDLHAVAKQQGRTITMIVRRALGYAGYAEELPHNKKLKRADRQKEKHPA